ncbi:hypothetical protein TNCV_2130751 [Trichonephila clavipes]|nr:hypothetical protein TNCV_2130751 [Trichonephila clavipes]
MKSGLPGTAAPGGFLDDRVPCTHSQHQHVQSLKECALRTVGALFHDWYLQQTNCKLPFFAASELFKQMRRQFRERGHFQHP